MKEDLLKTAFEYMLNSKKLILTDFCKNYLEGCWEHSSLDEWEIISVNKDFTLNILSEADYIFENANLEWFIFN